MNRRAVIVVVCLNPALDVTHHVPAVDWAGVNRPSAVHARPGGKGLNVARTLHALGAEVLVMGLAGGINGASIEAALGELRVPAAFTRISGEDPLAELVRVQKLAVAVARARGLDPDRPRNLARSVIVAPR